MYNVGQKEKRKKEISPFVNVSSSSNLFLFGHKTREKRRQRKTNFFREGKILSIWLPNLYPRNISRDLIFVISCASCARLAHFERERELERQRNDVSFSLSFFSLCETPIPRVFCRRRCARFWGTTTVPKTPTSSSSRRKTPTRTESDL